MGPLAGELVTRWWSGVRDLNEDERRRAIEPCPSVAGPIEEMSEAVPEMFRRFGEVLEVESLPASAQLRPVACGH